MAEETKRTINLTTAVIFALAVIAAFLGGMTVTRLGQEGGKSEGQEKAAQGTPAAGEQAQAQPEGAVLGDEDRAKIEEGGAAEKGPKDAPITIVEFSEYECPFCKRYVDETYSQLFEAYPGQIRYVFHDYPLPFHAHAQQNAEAARCAGDQGKYWEIHDLLFENRDEWAEATDATNLLVGYADGLGLDSTQFSSCLSSGKYTQAVKDDMTLGQGVGVSGTPSFFINGQKLVGAQPFANFKAIIDAELQNQ